MNQQHVRKYVEQYLAAFSSHIMETHPDFLTVKLPVEVDKDIGNRPFYWSWVEKMNLPYQPLVLTFCFDADRMPSDRRAEHLHLGAARLQQIFQSTRKHGSFVCMYETLPQSGGRLPNRRSVPLVPWLGVNWKISFICDKKRDLILHFGVNLHQPQIVHDFYPFLLQRSLAPSIPDYHYTLDRRITISQGFAMMEAEIHRILADTDQTWAIAAKQRLEEELQILEAYYRELEERQSSGTGEGNESKEDSETGRDKLQHDDLPETANGENSGPERITSAASAAMESTSARPSPPKEDGQQMPVNQQQATPSLEEHRLAGGRILDFLRANSFQETPREQIDQGDWVASTPAEEKQRRMEEMRWQYEPRVSVQFINGGLFYLQSAPLEAKPPGERRKM
ncbi:YqhG family protein [Brevibacillus borstelensis]|uniref:YqhG family protein n=1 Tax=Brevibacillus borstelensis TaxID=45462 RepID=UPI0030BF2CC6